MKVSNSRPGRISAEQLAGLQQRLSRRDHDVLETVERFRLLTARQLERACFAEGSPRTRARRCRATLRRLYDHGLLARLPRRQGGLLGGSAPTTYTLTARGARLLHPDAERLPRVRQPSPAFVAHRLGIVEIWLQCLEAARTGRLELLNFVPEPLVWQQFSSPDGQDGWLKPDAYLALGAGDIEFHWWLEVDCGTESGPALRRKAQTVVDAFDAGLLPPAGVFPRTLFIAPDQRRAAFIQHNVGQLSADAGHLIRTTTTAEALRTLVDDPALDRGS